MQQSFIAILHAAYIAEIKGTELKFTSRNGETITLTPTPTVRWQLRAGPPSSSPSP